MTRRWLTIVTLTIGLSALAFGGAFGQSQQQLDEDATRYMALGDSIAAGYKAQPATNGFAYRLYSMGVFDRLPHTLFCNAAVPGATSADVLAHQVPQALIPFDDGGFNPKYIVMTVGGNDLLSILRGADPWTVIPAFADNLLAILLQFMTDLPDTKIFIANQYLIPEFDAVGAGIIIPLFNGALAGVANQFPNAVVVDIYTAFLGRNGLFLIDRPGASLSEVHLTSAGHAAMAKAFADVIKQNK